MKQNIDKKKEFFKELELIENLLSNKFNADGNTLLKKINSVEQYLRVIGINIKDLKSFAKLDKNSDILDIDEKLKNIKFIGNIISDEAGYLFDKKLERESLEVISNGTYSEKNDEISYGTFIIILLIVIAIGSFFVYLLY